ncbi:MAG: N-acetylmuramoyl-L-alanine amidase [Clostridium sp.]|uniref:N-acetylmuramoyl-L-alanine amidase n=1 Tax=Clostridium sp. TaxID=1506 RepID=UPI00290277AF|nr:N-acetylmuramoyl-L-alanine amidase [Clostridium sp.]MDU1230852.1 N-acetylmuramoyl-L-alanine amidase [Clostridium sp.]
MSNFVIAAGHTASGNIGCGVVENLDESNCTREISQIVGKELKDRGHGVTLLRIDKGNNYKYEDCYVRAEDANKLAENSKIDLYAEIHINAGRGTGTEVCVSGKSAIANQYADKVCASLSATLGIPNRGVKTQSLIVLNKTSMPAILIECLFADSSDSSKYNAEVIARAIADGLVGAERTQNKQLKLGWNRNNIGWWYYTNTSEGYYYTSNNGWKCIDGEWYIFDDQGYALENAWYYDKNEYRWYYLDENCRMVYGSKDKPLWKCINDGCYAFDEEGSMYCDCVTPDGWKVNESGMWINN